MHCDLKTIIAFGLLYEVESKVVMERGFWLWKQKETFTTTTVKAAHFQKEAPVASNIDSIELPALGIFKVHHRILRADHIVIWLGTHGPADAVYFTTEQIKLLEPELASYGYVRII